MISKQLLLICATTVLCLMLVSCQDTNDERNNGKSYYLKQLNNADQAKRLTAIEKLTPSFPNQTDELEVFNKTLYDSYADVRLTSLRKISELVENGYLDKPEIVIYAVIDKLYDDDERIRALASSVLACIEDYYILTIPYLIEALDDRSMLVKEEAVKAIYHIALAIEKESMSKSDVNAQLRVALDILMEMKDVGDYEFKEYVLSAIIRIGDIPKERAAEYTMMLKDEKLRYYALLALQDIGVEDGVIDGVMGVLNDEREKVKREALITLEYFGPEARKAIPSLGEMVKSENEDIGYWVIEALGAIGAEQNEAGQILIGELEDAGWEKRAHIIRALISVYPSNEVKRAVIDMLRDENPEVRIEATKAIGYVWSETREVPAELKYVAEKDENDDVRESALEAINRINGDALW